MKIFSVSQIRAWDSFTMENEPVKSIALMERAALACSHWIASRFSRKTRIHIFCGKGNNGGDGLAIARQLSGKKYKVAVYIAGKTGSGSGDFETNLKKLKKSPAVKIRVIENEKSFPVLSREDVVIDALLGTGLRKKPAGSLVPLIRYLNEAEATVVSIDMPSGLFADSSSKGNSVVTADYTLSFQNQKLAFLVTENQALTGEIVLLSIGLSGEYEEQQEVAFKMTGKTLIKSLYQPRKPFAHKGNYGHACLIAGSYGMMGAAVLSSKACLRSGAGKLTSHIPKTGYGVVQTAVPEAMCRVSGDLYIDVPDAAEFSSYDAIGIGPGMGRHDSHKDLLAKLFAARKKPLVIDADALNVLSEIPSLYSSVPASSILTPHPGEFERLFGTSGNDFERIHLALAKAKELSVFIVLKGHYTLIATPEGKGYFNSTGNSGMATAGSGDVLTGILTGLLAQKYPPLHACLLGVYLHGLAGDRASAHLSKEALIASDIITYLGDAFLELSGDSFRAKDFPADKK